MLNRDFRRRSSLHRLDALSEIGSAVQDGRHDGDNHRPLPLPTAPRAIKRHAAIARTVLATARATAHPTTLTGPISGRTSAAVAKPMRFIQAASLGAFTPWMNALTMSASELTATSKTPTETA